MIRQVALLKCSYFRLLSVRRGGILTSETVKIAIGLLRASMDYPFYQPPAAFVNSVSLFLCRISNKKPMAFAIGFVFSASGQHQRQLDLVLVRVPRLAESRGRGTGASPERSPARTSSRPCANRRTAFPRCTPGRAAWPPSRSRVPDVLCRSSGARRHTPPDHSHK